jgi:hypothetical protein
VPSGTEVHDKAIVTAIGGPIPEGTVDFNLFSTINCTGPSSAENVALVIGIGESTAVSTPFTPVDGPLSFKVHYNGDPPIYDPADGPCEPVTVGAVGGIVGHTAITGSPSESAATSDSSQSYWLFAMALAAAGAISAVAWWTRKRLLE